MISRNIIRAAIKAGKRKIQKGVWIVSLTTYGQLLLACDEKTDFDILAQSLDNALLQFVEQAQISILIPSGRFSQFKTNYLKGSYCVEEALDLLVAGLDIEASIDESGQLMVRQVDTTDSSQDPDERDSAVVDSDIMALGAESSVAGNRQRFSERRRRELLEEIIVTGTRIKRVNGMTSPVPVTVVTTDEMFSFEPGGTIAEQLDALPQFFGTVTAQRGTRSSIVNGTGGGSYLNMRGLGAQRTLVLFDGMRMMPADKRGSVNVDMFPVALLRSIDVVTSGASAAYGADAMAGVTNFVLDREFEGLDVNTGYGITEWGDGQRWNMSVAGGKELGDRLNLIGSLEARHIKQIQRNPLELDSHWFKRWGLVTNPDWYPGAPAGIPQRLTRPWIASTDSSPTGIIWARKASSSRPTELIPFPYNGMTFLEDGSAVRPFYPGDIYASPYDEGSTWTLSGGPEAQAHNRAFNGGPTGREVVGRSLFLGAQYRFSDRVTGLAQVMAGRSESNFVQNRGNAYLADGKHATVFRNNAYLPEEIGLAMDDAGIDHFQLSKLGAFPDKNGIGKGEDHRAVFSSYSWNIGLETTFSNDWRMKMSWQSGESRKRTGIYDEIRIDRMYLAMDAVRHPETGAIVCNVQLYNPTEQELADSIAHLQLQSSLGGPLKSPIGLDNSIRDCVPFNVMGGGNMSQEAADYMTTPIIGESVVSQDFAELLVNGAVGMPWTTREASLAGGLTWREQSFSDRALPVEIDALGPPQNAPGIGVRGIPARYYASIDTLHKFSSIPTTSGGYNVWEWFGEMSLPVWESDSGSQYLNTELAFRVSDYSSIGNIGSWKAGLDFQVTEALRLRFTQSRDVREASFSERFDKQSGGVSVTDPLLNGNIFTTELVTGGNSQLGPEKADTSVAGFVYEPRWIPNGRLSMDWYRIDIKDAIGRLGPQRVVNDCVNGNAAWACSLVVRSPLDNSISSITDKFLNIDMARVEGVDIETVYTSTPNLFKNTMEFLEFRLLGGLLLERSDTPLNGSSQDIAGALGTPKFTAFASLSYNVGDYGVRLQQRYIHETKAYINWVEGIDIDHNTVSSGNYTNLELSYATGNLPGGHWDISLNVTNLFNRPPVVIASASPYAGSQVISDDYDVFGRRYQVNLNIKF